MRDGLRDRLSLVNAPDRRNPHNVSRANLKLCTAHVVVKSLLNIITMHSTFRLLHGDLMADVWLTVHRNSVWIRKTN